uniref:ADF-H domain-containing protein n=1 Tax=Amphimedon queenslandica TaxID=400682 RepID=A0A1X7VR29_AMPQE
MLVSNQCYVLNCCCVHYDSLILPCLQDKEACYILYRLDERNAYEKHLWVFLTYTPDEAPVRQKMLYSATKATMKKSFSSGVLIYDISATNKDEMTLKGYHKHVESVNAPPPLTREEEEWKEIEENQDHVDVGTTTRQSHLQGVSFPLHDDALAAIEDLKKKRIQYIQLSIDLDKEVIVLEDAADSLKPDDIASHISTTKPGYHLYLFKHTHEGDYLESFIFIYSCPGYKCSVKERMVYSSCKSPLIYALKEDGVAIDKTLELDDPSEVTEKFLMDELHPVQQAYRPQFAKPKPPGRKR